MNERPLRLAVLCPHFAPDTAPTTGHIVPVTMPDTTAPAVAHTPVANGQLVDLRQFDLQRMDDPAMFHLGAYLHNFRLERLSEFLQFPEVLGTADQMVAGFRLSRPAAAG